MRFEKSIDIDAPQQRVWDVLSALEAWPQRIETVDVVELLTSGADRQRQPRAARAAEATRGLPGTSRSGMRRPTSSGHRSRPARPASPATASKRWKTAGHVSTLTLDMRGLLIPIMTLFYKKLTNRYMNLEAEGMKRAAESA